MAKKCKPFIVEQINNELKHKILMGLKEGGASVVGSNPWTVDLNKFGIVIKADWNQAEQILKMQVVKRNFGGCKQIRRKVKKEIDKIRQSLEMIPFEFIASEEE